MHTPRRATITSHITHVGELPSHHISHSSVITDKRTSRELYGVKSYLIEFEITLHFQLCTQTIDSLAAAC